MRLKPFRKFCRLGDLAAQMGWHHNELINKLEAKRKTRSKAFYETKKVLNKLRAQAVKNTAAQLGKNAEALAKLGYPTA